MFSFSLLVRDVGLPWRSVPGGMARGDSFVVPYDHPALDVRWLHRPNRLILCMCERAAFARDPFKGHDPAGLSVEGVAACLRNWPLQWQMLAVTRTGVTLETGPWGTAPVFLRAGGEGLRGGWDPVGLIDRLTDDGVDPFRAARWIADYATPYCTRTMFPALRLLPERWRAGWRWPDGGVESDLIFTEPAAWPRPYAGTLHDGVDPVARLDLVLRDVLGRWPSVMADDVAFEISGGLDSALVAATAQAMRCRGARSYGLTLSGTLDAEQDQHRRRSTIVERLGLDDTAIAMCDHLPLAPGGSRAGGGITMPWEEGYYEAMEALLARAQGDGIRVMLTGFGGDELFGLRPSERRALELASREGNDVGRSARPPAFLTDGTRAMLALPDDRLPRAACSESAVEAAAFSTARYLRHGIWPVHPLCAPDLVHFCTRLPPEWRRGRRIERLLLERHGVATCVTRPRFLDSFSPVMARAMRGPARSLVERLFRAPALADLGIVDGAVLLSDYGQWCEGADVDRATQYYATAILELAIRGARRADAAMAHAR